MWAGKMRHVGGAYVSCHARHAGDVQRRNASKTMTAPRHRPSN